MLMNPGRPIESEKEQLLAEVKRLRQQVEKLQQDNHDLQIALETIALHGDVIEAQLQEANHNLQAAIAGYQQKQTALQRILERASRQKADLEVILDMTVEHGDTVEAQLQDMNQRLTVEITERQQAEVRLQSLLEVISKEKDDLEIIMRTIIEHGDAIGDQWYNQALEATYLAMTDSLTQVANRRKLDDYLVREWQRMIREKLPISLILCDIDCFKSYNDTYGHPAGDEVLKQVANAIARIVSRPTDLVARYGGEEFAVVLANTHAQGALHVAERIRLEVEQLKIPHQQSPVREILTLSLGVSATIPIVGTTPAKLVVAADRALYEAKKQRNRIAFESE